MYALPLMNQTQKLSDLIWQKKLTLFGHKKVRTGAGSSACARVSRIPRHWVSAGRAGSPNQPKQVHGPVRRAAGNTALHCSSGNPLSRWHYFTPAGSSQASIQSEQDQQSTCSQIESATSLLCEQKIYSRK